jgi:hypothetical protein
VCVHPPPRQNAHDNPSTRDKKVDLNARDLLRSSTLFPGPLVSSFVFLVALCFVLKMDIDDILREADPEGFAVPGGGEDLEGLVRCWVAERGAPVLLG